LAGLVDCAEPAELWPIAPLLVELEVRLADVLGLDDVSELVDGLVEALELDELLGLDAEVEPSLPVTEDDEEPWPCTPRAASVCWSRLPVCGRPCDCWKLRSALCVAGPIWPSIAPASKPFSFSACCAERTSDVSWLADGVVESLDEAEEF
jgi:hypothetical protein